MKLNMKNLIGAVVGVVIIILSITIFARNINMSKPEMNNIFKSVITAPEEEENEYYGGDAYTGMQQAAAQAANNLIPVFEATEDARNALIAANDNIQIAAKAQANNLAKAVAAMQYCFGMLLLSVGLLTVAKNLGAMLEDVKFKPVGAVEDAVPVFGDTEAENEETTEEIPV